MKIIKDAQLSEILWYRIGGTAKYLIECPSEKDVLEAATFIKKEKISKVFVAGLGSNLLFTDEDFDGAVIRIATNDTASLKLVGKDTVEAFAGVELDSVIQFSFQNNLIGLEWAGGLPGTIGAGIRGNVGAFGGEISKSFSSIKVIDLSEKKTSGKSVK